MWTELGLTDPGSALLVVISTVGIYLVFLVVIAVVGQRSLAAIATYDIACVTALGAVIGRTTLLAEPTLATGVVALVTLCVMQRIFRLCRRRRVIGGFLNRQPVLLVADGRVVVDGLRRSRVSDQDLHQRLRMAGIARLEDVALAVLESNGQISVLRRGGDGPDARLLADVPGAARAWDGTGRD
jgi:uncharacterized membrane protein YcaP (DUF421 family)